jgi:hypothetical protein
VHACLNFKIPRNFIRHRKENRNIYFIVGLIGLASYISDHYL